MLSADSTLAWLSSINIDDDASVFASERANLKIFVFGLSHY